MDAKADRVLDGKASPAGYIRTTRRGNDGVVIFIARAKKKTRNSGRSAKKVTDSVGSLKISERASEVPCNSGNMPARFPENQGADEANPMQNQELVAPRTKSLSYSEKPSLLQERADAKSASVFPLSLKEILKKMQVPASELSERQLQARRSELLSQAETIKVRYMQG